MIILGVVAVVCITTVIALGMYYKNEYDRRCKIDRDNNAGNDI